MGTLIRFIFAGLLCFVLPAAEVDPKTVHFKSADHQTELVAYVFEPANAGPHPAIVLLHGRSGAYSSLANGVYTAHTLSKRHKFWGHFWADRGYVAVLVDSFGPRGYWAGFPKGSHAERPPEVSEETARPLDALGALHYLKRRPDVDPDHIGVQGWSNGAMTTLVTVGKPESGFKAAIAEYPGCQMPSIQGDYHSATPILLLLATHDDEVGYKGCRTWAEHAIAGGNTIDMHLEEGAVHDFDDPSPSKQDDPANRKATEDAIRRGTALFEKYLRP